MTPRWIMCVALALLAWPGRVDAADRSPVAVIMDRLGDLAMGQKPYDRAALGPAVAQLDPAKRKTLAATIMRALVDAPADQLAAIEVLWLALIDLCPDTESAQKGYWRLSNMYLQAFDSPQHEKIAKLMEQFLARYGTNSVFPLVKYPEGALVFSPIRTLHQAYEGLGRYQPIVTYYQAEARKGRELSAIDCFDYATALEKTGARSDAVAWYRKFLATNTDSSSFMVGLAEQKIGELSRPSGQ